MMFIKIRWTQSTFPGLRRTATDSSGDQRCAQWISESGGTGTIGYAPRCDCLVVFLVTDPSGGVWELTYVEWWLKLSNKNAQSAERIIELKLAERNSDLGVEKTCVSFDILACLPACVVVYYNIRANSRSNWLLYQLVAFYSIGDRLTRLL